MDKPQNNTRRMYNLAKARITQKLYAPPKGESSEQYQGRQRDANAALQIQRNIEASQTATYESFEQYAELTQIAQSEKEGLIQEEKKIGLLVFLVILFLCVVGDIIDAVTGGTIGWLIGLALDLILVSSAFIIKSLRAQAKDNALTIIGAIGGEKVPFLAFLPFRSALIIYLFIISRSKIPQKVVDIKSGFKGKPLASKVT